MLQVAGISKDLWRPKNFAYDLLVLKLASSETVKKLTDIIIIGENPEAVRSLCTSIYFWFICYEYQSYWCKNSIIFYFVLYDMYNYHQKYLYNHQAEHSDKYNWCVISC